MTIFFLLNIEQSRYIFKKDYENGGAAPPKLFQLNTPLVEREARRGATSESSRSSSMHLVGVCFD
jgi:hypothetical protein